jgi:hypothetical protein
MKFCENTSSGSRVFPYRQTDRQTDGQNMIKLVVAFHNFADVPKNEVSDLGFCVCVAVTKKLVD